LVTDLRNLLEARKNKWTIHLVTIGRRSGLPRPVTVWFVYLDGRLFVRTSYETHWGKNLIANPIVEAEVGGLRFKAEAERVNDQRLKDLLLEAYRRKYKFFDLVSHFFKIRGNPLFFELKVKEIS